MRDCTQALNSSVGFLFHRSEAIPWWPASPDHGGHIFTAVGNPTMPTHFRQHGNALATLLTLKPRK
eukprot:3655826-Pyramimonas_sp.AAC.1